MLKYFFVNTANLKDTVSNYRRHSALNRQLTSITHKKESHLTPIHHAQ